MKSHQKLDHLWESLKHLRDSFVLSRKLLDQLIKQLIWKDQEIESLREESETYRRQYEQELQKRRKLQSHPLAFLTRLGGKPKQHLAVKGKADKYIFETKLNQYSISDTQHFEFRGAFADALGRSPERVYLVRGADKVNCHPVSGENEGKLFTFCGSLTLIEGLNEIQVVAKFPQQKEMELDCFRVIFFRNPELHQSSKIKDYENWVTLYSYENEKKDVTPTFSLILPCSNPAPAHFWKTLQSFQEQTYPHWEAIVVDDGSQNPAHLDFLETLALEDKRIRVCFLDLPQGISKASTVGVNESSQDWLAFLNQNDRLAPDALARLAEVIGQHPEADVVYTDEDKPGVGEARVEPAFNPHLFMAQNFFNPLTIVRRELLGDDLRFQKEIDGAQDWNFWQRVVERTTPDRIVHMPHILFIRGKE